jgi:hypothetical protein
MTCPTCGGPTHDRFVEGGGFIGSPTMLYHYAQLAGTESRTWLLRRANVRLCHSCKLATPILDHDRRGDPASDQVRDETPTDQ